MSRLMTCSKGHSWDPGANGHAGDSAALRCPVCGAHPETIALESRALGAAAPEAKPTLPSAEPDAALPTWPSIPGYEILDVLGRGGMGVVYRARHLSLNRLVALKMVLAGVHAGPTDLARFRIEAEAVASLQHPNIVQIYEIGEHDGHHYLALELVSGGSLADKLTGRPFPPREAAQLVEALARAVHAAHQQAIVHRDLKPANILLQIADFRLQIENRTEDSSSKSAIFNLQSAIPKVTDFGLAKRLDGVGGQTKTGSIMGTPCYMAPEQAGGKNKEIGPATDIYAMGAILYELLTGQPPFRGETELDTLIKVGTEEPPSPRSLHRKVPRDLEIICLKCLQKDPDKRFPSALALTDDLRRFLDDEPIHARSMGTFERVRRWLKRRREVAMMLVGALATICLLLFCAGLGNLSKPNDSSDKDAGEQKQQGAAGAEVPNGKEVQAAGSDNKKQPAALPADLALVPQDALGFITVRIGDLWQAKGVERLRERLFKEHPEVGAIVKKGLADVERYWGLNPSDVERVTMVVLRPPGNTVALIVMTKKPYSLEKIRSAIGLPTHARKYNGQEILLGSHQELNVLYVAGPRVFVLGDAGRRPVLQAPTRRPDPRVVVAPGRTSLEELLEHIAQQKHRATRGPLHEGLQQAAKDHHIVVGFNPPAVLLNELGRLLAAQHAFRPLLGIQSATLTLDLKSTLLAQENGDNLRMSLRLMFADESRARAGQEAIEKALAFAQVNMKKALDEVARAAGLNDDTPGLGKLASRLINQMESALRLAEVRHEGNAVYLGLNLVTDLAELGVAVPAAFQDVRDLAGKIQSANQLRQLALAMHAYQTTYKRLPPAVVYDKNGKPMHSWRVLLLPFLTEDALFKQIRLNEPWNSPHNKKLLARAPPVFSPVVGTNVGRNKTYYQVFTGPDAPFPEPLHLGGVPAALRPFSLAGNNLNLYEAGPVVTLPGSFTDGTTDTILIVEAGEAVPWAKPVDLSYRKDKPLPPLGGQFKTGFYAAMADAAVRFVPRQVKEKSIRAAITPRGGETPGADWPR